MSRARITSHWERLEDSRADVSDIDYTEHFNREILRSCSLKKKKKCLLWILLPPKFVQLFAETAESTVLQLATSH